jgi:hypothetical protein
MPDLRARHLKAGRGRARVLGRLAVSTLIAVTGVARARAETVYLLDGDRVTGKTASQPGGLLRVQTPFGRLLIPKGRILKIVHDDGHEEVLNEPPPPPLQPKPPSPVRLILTISGKTFWQAWDTKGGGVPADPSLRLEVRADDAVVAAYVDSALDKGEIPKAVVNSFSFTPDDVALTPGPGVKLLPPDTRPGRIQLDIVLPPEAAGRRRLRLAYQDNGGTAGEPSWHDLVESTLEVDLKSDGPNVVQVVQDRGTMEFSQHHMKNVGTFRLEAQAE